LPWSVSEAVWIQNPGNSTNEIPRPQKTLVTLSLSPADTIEEKTENVKDQENLDREDCSRFDGSFLARKRFLKHRFIT
jgi:hypothetical protein